MRPPIIDAIAAPKMSWSGMPTTMMSTAPTAPAMAPTMAPSAGVTGFGDDLMYRFAAISPPTSAQMQQQVFTAGIADRMPRTTPPIIAGLSLSFMSVYTFSWEKIGKSRLGVSVAAEEMPPRRERQVHRARHQVEGHDDAQQRRRQEARHVRVLPHTEEPEREID